MRVTVVPFDLVEPAIDYTIYYRGVLDSGRASVGSEFKNEQQVRAELKNLREHGIPNPTIYQAPTPAGPFEDYLEIRKSLGMTGGPMYLLGINTSLTVPAGIPDLQKAVVRTMAVADRFGFSELYVYGKDEAQEDALKAEVPEYQGIREVGGKVFVAGSTGVFSVAGEHIDLFVHAYRPEMRVAQQWQAKGRQIFSYANPQTGPESPYRYRRNYGVVTWAAGYDGVMPYAYQHSFGNIWNDLDHPTYRDHVFAYPTVDGVIDTIAWEGFREAVDDVRYLSTVEEMVREARRSGDAEEKLLAAEATDFLDRLRNDINQLGGSEKYTHGFTIDLDEVRGELVTYATKLSAGG